MSKKENNQPWTIRRVFMEKIYLVLALSVLLFLLMLGLLALMHRAIWHLTAPNLDYRGMMRVQPIAIDLIFPAFLLAVLLLKRILNKHGEKGIRSIEDIAAKSISSCIKGFTAWLNWHRHHIARGIAVLSLAKALDLDGALMMLLSGSLDTALELAAVSFYIGVFMPDIIGLILAAVSIVKAWRAKNLGTKYMHRTITIGLISVLICLLPIGETVLFLVAVMMK